MRKKKENKSIKIILIVGFIILISVIVFGYFYLVYKNLKYSHLSRLTLVDLGMNNQVTLFSFEDNRGIIVDLPVNERITLAHGFGEYELGKVFALGELEKKGGILLVKSLENWLSIPIFGYFAGEKVTEKQDRFITDIIWQAILGKNKTNLSKLELFFVYLKAKKINELQVKVMGEETNLKDTFKDKRLREESFSVEVLNATDHSGLAQKAAVFLENAGGRVVRIADSEKKEDSCQLLINSNLKESYTLFWLKTVYNDCRFGEKESDSVRTDITLVLAEDEWKKWNEKW